MIKMAEVYKDGTPIVEYPKLVKTSNGKVRVLSKEEEAKVLGEAPKEQKKSGKASWG